VHELTDLTEVSQPTVSHHLRVLREAGLVQCDRRGVWSYYRVVQETIETLAGVFAVPADAR
jgi:ArsR family transcriptional regulator